MDEQGTASGRQRARVLAWVATAVVVLSAPLACSSDEGAVSVASTSPPRPDTSLEAPPSGGSSPDGDFCAAVGDFADRAGDATPTELLEDLSGLRAAAPSEVADDLGTIEGVLRTLTELDESDPGSFRTVLEALLDARVGAAIAAFGDYALSECDVRLEDGGLGGLGG